MQVHLKFAYEVPNYTSRLCRDPATQGKGDWACPRASLDVLEIEPQYPGCTAYSLVNNCMSYCC